MWIRTLRGEVGVKRKKRSNPRTRTMLPRPNGKGTEEFANLQLHFQETSAGYHNATSWEERKHLLGALKKIIEQAKKLIAEYIAEHSLGRPHHWQPNSNGAKSASDKSCSSSFSPKKNGIKTASNTKKCWGGAGCRHEKNAFLRFLSLVRVAVHHRIGSSHKRHQRRYISPPTLFPCPLNNCPRFLQ